ncbi:potassium channel family protein [Blastococcus sp. PRF04-17]|uniref:potassium channel family protein n=1 Tax=Blastococcus sp. PRF04-17 TaxID=2933797 RepID=UPI001FF33C00|nr:potassium channel family protein [Blastococcus sp. PRF04-17]UOY01939.1 potassium channel family protein [Blastococcus sp. PRF04-17]
MLWIDWLLTGVGAVVVLVALRDIFHTIWHPSGRGDLSHLVMRGLWRLGRRRRDQGAAGVLTGPLALALVIGMWLVLIIGGGALVYLPHLPEGFLFQSGVDVSERSAVLDAVYLSTVTLATLGFGDIVPQAGWLRIVVPMQGLIGFALLTASVTWVLQVYPALSRRRVLAVRLALLRTVPPGELLGDPQSTLAAPLLDGLAGGLVQARVDVTQYSETYYFRDGVEEAALPAMLSVASDLCAAGRTAPRTDVRVAADLLGTAIADFARVLDEQFLRVGGSTGDVLAAYAAAHHYGRQA